MKKSYTLYAVRCTLSLFVLVLLAGCGQGYLAEKLYWKAEETARAMPKDPKSVTPQDYQRLVRAYRRVAERCPLEPLAAQSQFIIAQIYILQGEYLKAEEELLKVTRNFSQNAELASRAHFMIGNLYEQQGNWDKAVSEYENVTGLYPLSSVGLRAPIYVAEHYQRGNKIAGADKAYNKAIKDYKKLINDYSGTSIAPAVKDYLALAYVSQGKWNEAIDVWQTIVNEYPQSQLGAGSLFTIGETYVRQIKDLQKAIEVYEEFVRRNPESKIVRHARFQIGRLYFIKDDFTKAREIFEEILKDYPKEIELCTNAQLAVAASYEKEGSRDKTLEAYVKLKADYPDTKAGLGVPLFIAQYYLREKRVEDAESAFREAIAGYEKLIKENLNPALSAEAQDFISLAYLNQQKWAQAIGSLKVLTDKYPDNPKASMSLFTIAAIYKKQLQEPKNAIETFQKFIQQYPGHKLASLARSEIESLQKTNN